MQRRISISSYSKAPWGLSVLLRVTGIFTGTTISPSLLLRQFPDRYASLSQRPVFLVNSRLGLFTAAPFPEHPFSRSYGVILPSSLTIVLSLTLGFSPHLPVSVCGTGTYGLASGFS